MPKPRVRWNNENAGIAEATATTDCGNAMTTITTSREEREDPAGRAKTSPRGRQEPPELLTRH
jgi:hypothetical protein